MPDEFEQIRDALNATQNGKGTDPSRHAKIAMLLDNQREIMACLATIARGGTLPISIAKDLKARADKITKILEG